jgi:hypothetical protein
LLARQLFPHTGRTVVVMRRSIVALSYLGTNADTDPSINRGVFGWSELLPQGMPVPSAHNREVSMPGRRYGGKRAYHSVWVDLQMHPAFRVALDPYLRKLPLTRIVPATKVADAAADYASVAPKVGDIASRHGWLAKVAQLGGLKRTSSEVLPLWAMDCHAMYVTGDAVPPPALAVAMCFCTAASQAPEWRSFFQCSLASKWDATKHFTPALWSELLACAGRLGDEDGVLALLDEMVDLQVNLQNIAADGFARAFNAVTGQEAYERIKKFLFMVEHDKVTDIFKRYYGLRAAVEREDPAGEGFRDNDNMFYHVHWHNTIRQPLKFMPRRQYFDYKPTTFVDDEKKFHKRSVDSILEERLAKWKEQGLVPDDYQDHTKVDDVNEKFDFWARQEKWKKKPTWKKVPGYTPHDQAGK